MYVVKDHFDHFENKIQIAGTQYADPLPFL
jgi:hypothetical protein